MHYPRGLKNQIDKCKISEWQVVLGVPDEVNIPCLMIDTSDDTHDTHISVKSPRSNDKQGCKYKISYDVKTGVCMCVQGCMYVYIYMYGCMHTRIYIYVFQYITHVHFYKIKKNTSMLI